MSAMTASRTAAADLVLGAYAAFARGDVPAVLAALDEDIRWDSPQGLPWSHGVHVGRDAVAGYFARLLQHVDAPSVECEELIDGGDGRIASVGRLRGTIRATGAPLDTPFVHLWTIRDGRAVGMRGVLDTAAFARKA